MDADGNIVWTEPLEVMYPQISIDQRTIEISADSGEIESGAYVFHGTYVLDNYPDVTTSYDFYSLVLGDACLATNEIITLAEGDNGIVLFVPIGGQSVSVTYPTSADYQGYNNNANCGTIENSINLYKNHVLIDESEYPQCLYTNIDEIG